MTRQTLTRNLRWPIAAALAVAAAAHVPVIPEHLHEAPYMGVLFIGFTLVAAGLALIVAARGPVSAPVLAAGALCAAAIGTYCLTRVIAFPQLGDDVGNWSESTGVISIASEAVVVALSVAGSALMRRISRDVQHSGKFHGISDKCDPSMSLQRTSP
jgi:hypothetical protein